MNRERELEATSKTVGRIAGDPITWAPFLPIAAAFAFLGTPWWICTAAGVGVATVLTAWWKRQWKPLREAAYLDGVRAQFARENTTLQARLDRALAARTWGRDLDQRLRPLVAHKSAIENEILDDAVLSADEREIALMAGRLCGGILAELETLSALPPGAAGEGPALTEIRRGLEAVERTREEIHTLLRPVPEVGVPTGRPLRDDAEQLQVRIDEARAIRRRLNDDLNLTFTEAPRQPEDPTAQ